MAVEKTARLDKKHGFLRQIIKNQIDRDEYDKEVKAQRQQQRRSRSQAWKRPDKNIYSPPKKVATSEDEKTEDLPKKEEVLEVQFENQQAVIICYMMYKGDHPRQVAKTIGRKQQLPQLEIQALAEIITEELANLKTGT
ncbi:hypothetical protein BSL78_12082 [Apostichopus japonicus]|uniref:Uncharacterized protein n=1 Tax=Stichopus japonicus TaxID=307972 RepID=A0A2G8KSQ2_STIJA|nr:hypothetical protein BSL78_12082 [Apostichopus japonicus]